MLEGQMSQLFSWARLACEIEMSHYVIVAVCIMGVLMAFLADEGATTRHGLYILSLDSPKTPRKIVDEAVDVPSDDDNDSIPHLLTEEVEAHLTGLAQSGSILNAVKSSLTELQSLAADGNLFKTLQSQLNSWTKKLQFLLMARAIRALATSRRHFFYLMQKKVLGLEIKKDESEFQSYLDCKRHMGEKWPFMWSVADVKNDKVKCAGLDCVPMSSYSYLDLLRDQRVQDAAIEAAKLWSTGNHGPRMLGGNTTILCHLEQEISKFFDRDSCLLCVAGFLACMSATYAIGCEGDIVFADSRLHASLRSGLNQCEAKVVNFKHNDFKDCLKKCQKYRKSYKHAWLIVESVYSMDGDIADLPAAYALSKEFDLKIMIDEAHGLGVLGPRGRGLEDHFGLPGVATLIVGTFSKSVASVGGYICGPKNLIDCMDFYAPGNVFSAPLPAYCAGAAMKAFELIDSESWRVLKAQENSKILRKCLETGLGLWPEDFKEEHKYFLDGDAASTVIPAIFPDDIDRVMRIATSMKKQGWMLSAVAFPACPLRRPRFRITATTHYTEDLIKSFVSAFVLTTIDELPSEASEMLRNVR